LSFQESDFMEHSLLKTVLTDPALRELFIPLLSPPPYYVSRMVFEPATMLGGRAGLRGDAE
jgi:hypothetical protein